MTHRNRTHDFRSGLNILLDGQRYIILRSEFIQPGKGQAFYRMRIRHVKTGRVMEKTLKAGETVETADGDDRLSQDNPEQDHARKAQP